MSFLKKAGKFLALRIKEPSTYAGLAIVATAVGLPGVALVIGKVGVAAGLILGGGLVAMSQHPSDDDHPA